jgi:hypothetical protein
VRIEATLNLQPSAIAYATGAALASSFPGKTTTSEADVLAALRSRRHRREAPEEARRADGPKGTKPIRA